MLNCSQREFSVLLAKICALRVLLFWLVLFSHATCAVILLAKRHHDDEDDDDLCGSVAEWLERWTCDPQVAGSTPGRRIAE